MGNNLKLIQHHCHYDLRKFNFTDQIIPILVHEPRLEKLTHGYHLGGQLLVVIFDFLDVYSSQFGMIAIADW